MAEPMSTPAPSAAEAKAKVSWCTSLIWNHTPKEISCCNKIRKATIKKTQATRAATR